MKPFLCAVLVAACGAALGQQYHLTDLGHLPQGTFAVANGLSPSGIVTGINYISGSAHAYRWTDSGGMTDIGGPESYAFDVNDAGWVALRRNGYAAVYTPQGGVQDLFRGSAYGINASGQVTGEDYLKAHAFLWSAGSGSRDLGTLGGVSSIAHDVNDGGVVVGESNVDINGPNHAFIWSEERGMEDVGALQGYKDSGAMATNMAETVVGYSGLSYPDPGRAFIWNRDTGIHDLGSLGSYAYSTAVDINNAGQVVGTAFQGNSDSRACMWDPGLGVVDLNTLLDGSGAGWLLADARAINDRGQIVGAGYLDGGVSAYLLTPVPEPSSLLALGLLGAPLLRRRRR